MSEVSTPDPAVQAMRLRAEPPKPLRLSRKVALAGAAGLAVAVAAAAVVGLSTQDDAAPAQELTPSSAPAARRRARLARRLRRAAPGSAVAGGSGPADSQCAQCGRRGARVVDRRLHPGGLGP